MGDSSSHSEVCTGSEASAEKVVVPTKCNAPSVRTGETWAPPSTKRRQTSIALYAAIPPVTPRTMRRPWNAVMRQEWIGANADGSLGLGLAGGFCGLGVSHGLDAHWHDLVGGDLLEGDRERLAGC